MGTGEVFGLLGPNGAGKTTTLEIVEGIQRPTSGAAHILGIQVASRLVEIKPRIGIQLQTDAYPERLNLVELLEMFAFFYGRTVDAEALLESVGLTDKRRSLVSKLSGGQTRRFSIVVALAHGPEVVFLDEPTSGLDPQGRLGIWELIRRMRDEGTTVVLTTHYMEEAEALCDRVGIIDHGAIRALDTPIRLIRRLDAAYHIRFTTPAPVVLDRLSSLPGAVRLTSRVTGQETQYDLEVHDPAPLLPLVADAIGEALASVTDFRIEPATLEDVFLSMTGKELRD